MPVTAFNALLDVMDGRDLIAAEHLKIIVFDAVEQKVEQWLE